tara:strand:+ start:265 stop:1008 length:744 start_codon:yes stop_codon:yes gene_type:complete
MKRAGSHAVLDWITTLFPGNVCFLNDVINDRTVCSSKECCDLPSLPLARRTRAGDEKDLLLFNLEDPSLANTGTWWLDTGAQSGTAKRVSILLLRDPFNLFASRLKAARDEVGSVFSNNLLPPFNHPEKILHQMWIEHAREFLNETSLIDGQKVIINYNQWCFDEGYRQTLSREIGGNETTGLTQLIPRQGFGSSFEGWRGRVLKNRVGLLNRWRHFQEDSTYLNLIENEEMQKLSLQIFGPIRDEQ